MSIDISVVIWTVISFFLLLFLLNTFLFKPVTKFMDERKARINAGLEEGEKAKAAKEENQQQLDDELRKAGGDAKQIIADGKSEDEKARAAVLAKAHDDAVATMKSVRAKVGDEEKAAYSEVEIHMPELVCALTGKLLGDTELVCANSGLIQSCVAETEKQTI